MRLWLIGSLCTVISACGGPGADETADVPTGSNLAATSYLRVASFNVSLYRSDAGALIDDLASAEGPQLETLRNIIGMVDPDILVLNEFDYDAGGVALDRFAEFLDQGYDHRLPLAANTGVPSGFDLDKDGRSDHEPGTRDYGNDAFGYGTHEGQYAIAVLSRYPLDAGAVRTFQNFLWADMPGNLLPKDYYGEGVAASLRLSSKTHADVPVEVGDEIIHLIVAHPTPPGFDGPEDRNGRRNYDEVRFLREYVSGEMKEWITDDQGKMSGLPSSEKFIIFGDLNADPVDGDVPEGFERHAIADLIDHPRVQDPEPRSAGGVDAADRQGGGNLNQRGDHGLDTGDFSDNRIGNLRVDYVLPSSNLMVTDSGVFWPASNEPHYDWVGPGYPPVSSDHRLVWVDIDLSN